MDASQNHIIQTVCFDAIADSEESAVAFADAVSGLNHAQLFNEILSRYSTVTETIQLQKVELDIGEFNADNFHAISEELLLKFEEVIKQQLKLKRNKKRSAASNPASKNSSAANDTETTNPIDKLSAEKRIELILYYFKTGRLPWYITSQPDIEKLFIDLLEHDAATLKKYFLAYLSNERVIKRIVITLSYKVINLFIKTIIEESVFNAVETFIVTIKKVLPPVQHDEFNKQMAAIYLRIAAKTEKGIHVVTDAFINEIKNLLLHFSQPVLKTLFAEVEQLLLKKTSSELENIYKNVLIQISKITGNTIFFSEHQTLAKSIVDSTEKAAKEIPAENQLKNELVQQPADTESENDSSNYFIDNAGLVLLNAALLQKAFERLGWVKDKKITDEKSRDKILLWMDYLIWGKRKTHEYGLMLNKVLLGIEPEDIVDISLTLTAKEMNKADELLKTVIQYWTILKNTSADGFRNSFLQRNGRLGYEDGGWQLFVETKGFDILIDSLPWSFSIIKFPWMEKPLFTQWQTKV